MPLCLGLIGVGGDLLVHRASIHAVTTGGIGRRVHQKELQMKA
jgi:hypothetical protein